MDIPMWIVIAAVVIVALYFATMRGFFRQSREVDRKTDFNKIAPLKDDED